MTEHAATAESPALSVDDDQYFEDARLPALFLRTDDEGRQHAAREIGSLAAKAGLLHGELELIERALRFSETRSSRYGEVRVAIRQALAGLEHGAMNGLDRARLALG